LLCIANPRSAFHLIDFCNNLKKGGLYIIGHVILGDITPENVERYKLSQSATMKLIDQAKIKAFTQQTIADSVRVGIRNLLNHSGLGGMKANTLVIGFYDAMKPQPSPSVPSQVDLANFSELRTEESTVEYEEYVNIIRDTILVRNNIIIARNFNMLNKQYIVDFSKTSRSTISQFMERFDKSGKKMTIDIYPLLFPCKKAEQITLLTLILASLLNKTDYWKATTLRAIGLVETREEIFSETKKLRNLLQQNSIVGETNVLAIPDFVNKNSKSDNIPLAQLSKSAKYERINDILQANTSPSTGVIFLPLEPPAEDENNKEYISNLDILTKNLPPVLLVYGALNVLKN